MKLGRIAEAIGGRLSPQWAETEIARVASPEDADGQSLVFMSDPRMGEAIGACKAPAVIVSIGATLAGKQLLEIDDPYVGYARASQLFEDRSPVFGQGIHSTAVIDASARIGSQTAIGPGCIVGARCIIGDKTELGARVVVERGAVIGGNCRIDSGAVIRRDVRIGNRVIIQSGTVVGSEGFGNAQHKDGWVRIPCFGTVIVEDDAEIGANVTVDRGNFTPTIIHRGARIDNLVHIAHNVEIGEHTAIAAQTGISGSTRVGSRVLIGGQAGFVGHISIGDGAFVGAQAGVSKSVEPGAKVTGYPARDLMTMRRIEAAMERLPEIIKQLRHRNK